jgi:hypothetical protein
MQGVHTSYQKFISPAIYVGLKKMKLLHNVIPFWRSDFCVYVWGHCDGDVTHGELFEKTIWHTFSKTTWLNANRLIFAQHFCVYWMPMCALQGRNKCSTNIFTLAATSINARQFLHLFISPAHRECRHTLRNEIKKPLLLCTVHYTHTHTHTPIKTV